MLGTLRKHSKSVIVYVLFGIIIVVFVFTFNVATPDLGCGTTGQQTGGSYVTIGQIELGTTALNMGLALTPDPPSPSANPLDPNNFKKQLIYRQTRFWYLGQDDKYVIFNPDPQKVSMIKIRRVMDDLEETYLVSEAAEKAGLFVSPREVAKSIYNRFTNNGKHKFNSKYYRNWVMNQLGTTIPKFEDFIRRELLREKMIDLISSMVTLSDRDKKVIKDMAGWKLECEYASVDPEKAVLINDVTDKVAQDYLSKHKAEVKQYFQTHQSEFNVPDKFMVHILEVSGTSEDSLNKIKDLQQKIKDAKDNLVPTFELIARENSDNVATKAAGGKISEFLTAKKLAQFDPAIAEWVTSAAKGALSKPLKGKDGYYLCYVDDVKRGHQMEWEEAKLEAAKRVVASRDIAKAVDKYSKEFLEYAKKHKGQSLKELAKQFNATVADGKDIIVTGTTSDFGLVGMDLGSFMEKDPTAIPSVGIVWQAVAKLIKAKKGEVLNQVFKPEGSKTGYVLRLVNKEHKDVDKDKLSSLYESLLKLKRVRSFRRWYARLRMNAIKKGILVEHENFTRMVAEAAKQYQKELKNALRRRLKDAGK